MTDKRKQANETAQHTIDVLKRVRETPSCGLSEEETFAITLAEGWIKYTLEHDEGSFVAWWGSV